MARILHGPLDVAGIKNVLRAMLILAVVAVTVALAVVLSGVYDVAATRQHLRPVYWVLAKGLSRSIALHSSHLRAPPPTRAAVLHGADEYEEHCRRCHGAPGVAPDAFALGMEPVPINLVYAAQESKPEEIFWAVKHGIKMTGMPAWEYRMDDTDIWALTAFVTALPDVSPAAYHDMLATAAKHRSRGPQTSALPTSLGRPSRGKAAIPQYGCTACHMIPGIIGRKVRVGPPLRGVALRNYLAGELPNTPANMMRWLLDTHRVEPRSAMPSLGLTPRDAADITAYLYTLDGR